MIKNEKQYKISKKKLQEIKVNIDEVEKATNLHPLRNKLMMASLLNMQEEISKEVADYELLKKKKFLFLKERLISDLPTLLTEYKIISGLTQKEFSEKLGLKEQQLQRYEADNFKSVSFKNLLRFLDLIGLEIRIKETRLNKNRRQATKIKTASK